jgi:hypothetical protein
MPVFSRRVLQRLLDDTAEHVTKSQHARWLSLLNAADERSLDTEWEVVLLAALARLGEVTHEPPLQGKRPDLLFRDENVEFVADIATVSDRGYEEANRRVTFERELWSRVRAAGLSPAGFSYRIEGEEREGKMRLLLPANDRWDDLFDQNFKNLLAWVRIAPAQPVALRREGPGFDVSFWYSPQRDSIGSGYPSYRYSRVLTKTPIYNALKRKKEQLKACQYPGLLGIVLCDGDCEAMRSPERIVDKFFRDSRSVDFVVIITLSGDRFSRREEPIRLRPRCFFRPNVPDIVSGWIRGLFEKDVPNALPAAKDDVVNALNHLRWKKRRVGLSHEGGYAFWGGRYMRISSRALLELLGGVMSSERFLKLHRFVDDELRKSSGNPFAAALEQGRMIVSVTVERDQDEDDDWIIFEFSERDPAISDFSPKGTSSANGS